MKGRLMWMLFWLFDVSPKFVSHVLLFVQGIVLNHVVYIIC